MMYFVKWNYRIIRAKPIFKNKPLYHAMGEGFGVRAEQNRQPANKMY
jgi:hypothetical protein